jgi:hypothetical protein
MSKYKTLENPYKYPQEDWYLFNNIIYLCDILIDQSDFPEEVINDFYEEYKAGKNIQQKQVALYGFLLYLGLENPTEYDAPANGLADLLSELPEENIPKVMYLINNPDAQEMPKTFNAFTHPELFPTAQETESSYISQDTYNEVLKKALDSRNNTLDARKFNKGLTAEQIVALANNKLDLSTKPNIEEDLEINSGPDTLMDKDLAFSPNSIVNMPSSEVKDSIAALTSSSTSAKVSNLMESKKRIVTQKPQLNLEDLLNKE